jgi:hypothetical protein
VDFAYEKHGRPEAADANFFWKNARQRGIHSAVMRGRPLTKTGHGNLAHSPADLSNGCL